MRAPVSPPEYMPNIAQTVETWEKIKKKREKRRFLELAEVLFTLFFQMLTRLLLSLILVVAQAENLIYFQVHQPKGKNSFFLANNLYNK